VAVTVVEALIALIASIASMSSEVVATVPVTVAAMLILSQHERFSYSMGPYTELSGSKMTNQWSVTSVSAHW